MALDYYLKIKNSGTQEKQEELHNLLLTKFMLTKHQDTQIMTAPGIGVSIFLDSDNIEKTNQVDSILLPNLTICFRINKLKLQKEGYKLLQKIIQNIFDTVNSDMYLTDEYGDAIFLKKESGKITRMLLEHDIWMH